MHRSCPPILSHSLCAATTASLVIIIRPWSHRGKSQLGYKRNNSFDQQHDMGTPDHRDRLRMVGLALLIVQEIHCGAKGRGQPRVRTEMCRAWELRSQVDMWQRKEGQS
jgi:hypothetical protein